MSLPAPRLPFTQDPDLRKAVEVLRTTLGPISQVPLLDGVLLDNVVMPAGALELNHRLGRAPLGWLVVRKRGTADLWDEQDANPRPAQTLRLVASAAVVVDLWIF